jgi:hypothetical protein
LYKKPSDKFFEEKKKTFYEFLVKSSKRTSKLLKSDKKIIFGNFSNCWTSHSRLAMQKKHSCFALFSFFLEI